VTADCNSGTKGDAIRAIISDAQRHYADAIAVLLRNGRYSSGELRELELDLVRTIGLIGTTDASGIFVCELCIEKPGGTPRLDLEPWRSWRKSMALLAEWELPQPGAEPVSEQREPDGKPSSSRFSRCLDACIGRLSLQRSLAYEIAA